MPSGICKVKGGPNEAAADAFIDAYLGPEIQAILVEKSFVLPTNPCNENPGRLRDAGANRSFRTGATSIRTGRRGSSSGIRSWAEQDAGRARTGFRPFAD